jgi:hypothetical protein
MERTAEMAKKRPKRFKELDDLSIEEHLEHGRTGQLPETDEYQEARREALEDAGLYEELDDEPVDEDDMSPADHYKQIRGDR